MAVFDAKFLELNFASKERSLSPRRFVIHEGLSTCFEANVFALSKDYDLDLDKIVGKQATFRILSGLIHGTSPGRCWTGVCSLMEQVRPETKGESTYFLRIVPKLWLLSQRRDHRIFQRMTLLEIVQAVLKDWQIEPELEIKKTYLKHDYIVQYGETDLDFVSRLLERAGITYFFRSDATSESALVLSDEPHHGIERPAGVVRYTERPNRQSEREYISRVRILQSVTPGDAKIRDFDFRRRPDFKLFGDAVPADAPEDFYQQYRYLPGAGLRVDPPDGTSDATPVADDKGKVRTSPDALAKEATIGLEADRSRRRRVAFETNCMDLAPGVIFSMYGHPRGDLGEKLLLTETTLTGHATGDWIFAGAAVFAAEPYRPAKKTPRPRVRGLESAVVVGPKGEEIHTDEFGRVRIQRHWDRDGQYDDNSSCWVRVSQLWAGAGFGSMLIPRVGQEVLVGFLDGDPDQPMIVGRVYNKTVPVPYKLPDSKTRSGWRSKSSPRKEGFNEILLEDKQGEELFYIQAERDLQKLVKREETERTGENRFSVIGRDRQEVVKTVDATMVGETLTLQMIKQPSASDLQILPQREPKVSPRPTKMEMKDKRLYFTTGRATVSFEDKNILFEAEKNITIHAEGGDVVLEGSRAYINTITPPAALSGKDIIDPDLALFSPPPTEKPGLLSRMKTALVGALNLGAKVAITLKTANLKLLELALRKIAVGASDLFGATTKDQKQFDGQYIGKGCEPSPTEPSEGVRPKKCPGGVKGDGKKIYFVNGINTKAKENGKFEGSGMCANMHAIADANCAEVVGIYNATEGMARDLDECLDNIGRAGKTPAAKSASDEMMRHLTKEPPEKMTIYAHSQGGLITQEALIDTKARLMAMGMTQEQAEARMANLEVKSFGTAVAGWPAGPQYERFTNLADPVPYVIATAQGVLYPVETLEDTTMPNTHVFTDPHKNVIGGHGMVEAYMPYMDRQKTKETGLSAEERCECK